MIPAVFIDRLWYSNHPVSWLLAPLGWGYQLFMRCRRLIYQAGIIPIRRVNVPVIVVGNLTVGGNGKTPLVIWLCRFLQQQGYRPGIVSRGYGGKATHWPQQVRPDSDPVMCGDEPVMLARRSGCPVAAAPNRHAAASGLLQNHQCDIIISDDGLQHLGLARDIEIIVINSKRRFGNGRCLPAGPLRESAARRHHADMIVSNGKPQRGEFEMSLLAESIVSLRDANQRLNIDALDNKAVHAVAGIGFPERFFQLLRQMGLQVIEHAYPDHHPFVAADVQFGDRLPVIMTEKDAVKCQDHATDQHWFLAINVKMTDIFEHRLSNLLKGIHDGQKTA